MGTTLVVAVFRASRLLLGHVGDSRCYRLRAGRLVQLTRDHSLLQEQIDAGLITPEQAAFSANKNLVTRAVGVEDTVELETHQHEVQADDTYLLCSDGLSDMLDDAAIAQLRQARAPVVPHDSANYSANVPTETRAPTPAERASSTGMEISQALETTAHQLIAAANDAGGRDNISVVLIRVCGGANPAVKSWWPFRR
jgi:protein phosphatase